MTPDSTDAMISELVRIVGQCDGVHDCWRCPSCQLFSNVPGPSCSASLLTAATLVVLVSDFIAMAEVYWDLEVALRATGLQLRLRQAAPVVRDHHARPVQKHSCQGSTIKMTTPEGSEPRASATFPPGVRADTAIITFCFPFGLRFAHQDWSEGAKRISPHLSFRT